MARQHYEGGVIVVIIIKITIPAVIFYLYHVTNDFWIADDLSLF